MTNLNANNNIYNNNEYIISKQYCVLKNDIEYKKNIKNKWKNSINIIKNIINNIPDEDEADNNNNNNNQCCEVDVRPKFMRYLLTTIEQFKEHYDRQQEKIQELIAENYFLKIKPQEEAIVTDDDQCCVCMTKKKDHAFTGCGHMCVCGDCVDRCENKCPLCRTEGNYMRIHS